MGMPRLVLAISATVLLVAFAMANTHHVELSLVFGRPAEVRLIFLIGTTYVAGVLTGTFWGMVRRLKKAESKPPRLEPVEPRELLEE